ncbi:MAG: dihydrodipicolinate synthase family protein [Bacillota bacterium]
MPECTAFSASELLLNNIPMRTGIHLEPETVARLSAIQNIVNINDSSGSFDNIKSYLEKSDPEFAVLAGTDSLIYSTLEAGGKGAIAATARDFGVSPDDMELLIDAAAKLQGF